MCARRADDAEVERWRKDGWVLVEGLVGTDEIDSSLEDLHQLYPTGEEYHADPAGETSRHLGSPPPPRDSFPWPDSGPGFRPEQHRWISLFPFPGTGVLNRLTVHPMVVDFAERALGSTDIRLYQAHASAKYTGFTNYEQPMHTDRNHSWIPSVPVAPWWHLEGFLYLSDVEADTAPTHLVSAGESQGRRTTVPLVMPEGDPDLYGAERPAPGVRGSLLAYRTDVFHRAVDLVKPGGSRYLLSASFKITGQDWIGYHSIQSRATSGEWIRFVEGSTPRELSLFGFPPPGHPIWSAALIEETKRLYPKLDLNPWRSALET